MRTRKVSSKAEKNSNRAALKPNYHHYGKAMLFGYFEITKRFACGQDAIDWLRKVKSGWRAKVYDAHIYYDRFALKPMVKGFDAFRFAWAKKRFGLDVAMLFAKEGAF